jgi:hypothetical protein
MPALIAVTVPEPSDRVADSNSSPPQRMLRKVAGSYTKLIIGDRIQLNIGRQRNWIAKQPPTRDHGQSQRPSQRGYQVPTAALRLDELNTQMA